MNMARNVTPVAGAFFTLCLATGASDTSAQPAVTVSSAPSCVECRVAMSRMVTLGDSIGPGTLEEQGTVVADGRGRYYFTANRTDRPITVFDASGRFLATIGRQGQGPGEFSARPLLTFAANDSLVAMDNSTRRLSVFAPSYTFARSVPIPLRASEITATPTGAIVVATPIEPRQQAGEPIHLFDSRGRELMSFGSGDARPGLGGYFDRQRLLGPGTGAIWSSRMNAYSVQKWNPAGQLLLTITREADWFRPWSDPPAVPGQARRPPELYDLTERGDTLWVLIRVDDADWRPREPVPLPENPNVTYTPDTQLDLIFDTIVEVIDVRARQLIVSQRFSQRLIGFVAHGVVASYEEDEQGNPRYVIWELSVGPR